VSGKIYHALLFERGQKVLDRIASMEKQQRNKLQNGLTMLVGPPEFPTIDEVTEEHRPYTRPLSASSLRAEAPPFVSTENSPASSRNSGPSPNPLISSLSMASMHQDEDSHTGQELAHAHDKNDAQKDSDDEDDDDDDDDEEILFNSSTIL